MSVSGLRSVSCPADPEFVIAAVGLAASLVIGLYTASSYGISIDEFNTDDYGPKALAWYTSGFADRSQFESVEFSLWYYGPWFQIATALVQSLGLGDRFAVRHAMTFLVGWGGIAALLPLGRLVAGRWAGLVAIILCLGTGYLYGSLFFTTIDVPFLAAMTWATLAIVLVSQSEMPSWRVIIAAGLAMGLSIGTRTGGVITFGYLGLALMLCAVERRIRCGSWQPHYVMALAARYVSGVAIAIVLSIAIWPWLQLGNPFAQFGIAFRHFTNIVMSYEFSHWGERIRTDALPLGYVPEQLAARLPEAFLLLLAVAIACGIIWIIQQVRFLAGGAAILAGLVACPRLRGMLLVLCAALMPVALVMIQHTRIYDGIRHLLFVIPMLAIVAGAAFAAVLSVLRSAPILFAVLLGAYGGAVVVNLATLHPLEYVAMNVLAGGTWGAYGKFELDYSSIAAKEAIRQLEDRLRYTESVPRAPTHIMVCIPWREWAVAPMLQSGWITEPKPDGADYIIETERWRCASGQPFQLIDEVRRAGRPFAWIYQRADQSSSQR